MELIVNCSDVKRMIFFNLCDGTEEGEGGNGYPGVSVIKVLQELGLNYTGSDEAFYECSCSKVLMKQVMEANGVSTSPYVEIRKETIEKDVIVAIDQIGFPLFVKLVIS